MPCPDAACARCLGLVGAFERGQASRVFSQHTRISLRCKGWSQEGAGRRPGAAGIKWRRGGKGSSIGASSVGTPKPSGFYSECREGGIREF